MRDATRLIAFESLHSTLPYITQSDTVTGRVLHASGRYAGEIHDKSILNLLEQAETPAGLSQIRSALLPTFRIWYVVSCPPVLQEEALEIMKSSRAIRLFAVSQDGTEGVRVADEQWK